MDEDFYAKKVESDYHRVTKGGREEGMLLLRLGFTVKHGFIFQARASSRCQGTGWMTVVPPAVELCWYFLPSCQLSS